MKVTYDLKTINSIIQRAHYLFNQMIFMANHRKNKEKGDPKVGGHSSGSASALHILGVLHLLVKTGFDFIVNKPHASPCDHAFNYLLRLFLKKDLSRCLEEEFDRSMKGLRAFSQSGEFVFQSYHSPYDPDFHNFLPSGTVGIPPVSLGYLALAYRMAGKQNYLVPKKAHFWAVAGDAEFREGSLLEAAPDFAERKLGEITWIIDYNRQGLDGHRIRHKEAFSGNDSDRIYNTMKSNGWHVIDLCHGQKRQKLFRKKQGQMFQTFLEKELDDYELQALLMIKDKKFLKKKILETHKKLKPFLDFVTDEEFYEALRDLGGHDLSLIEKALRASKETKDQPSIVICHTLKGWGLDMVALQANHSSLPSQEEMLRLRKNTGLKETDEFKTFDKSTKEGQFLKRRSDELYKEILEQSEIKKKNKIFVKNKISLQDFPESFGINLKLVSYPHTQWMLGQVTAKLSRIAVTDESDLKSSEKKFKKMSELFVQMSPDVATSTNLNPAFDGKIFSTEVDDFEKAMNVKDKKSPDLVPREEASSRFIRFDITEANSTSCLGSFGKLNDILGIPFFPLMTIYDFFIKRALDQHFYNLYWGSSFLLCGTPSGVTLSPEGAQHGWKSNFEIPRQITWEPFYCIELDWIFLDALKRHFQKDNKDRMGVHIRCVTRGVDQKGLMSHLKTQKTFKKSFEGHLCSQDSVLDKSGIMRENEVENIDEDKILERLRKDVLKGAYYLKDYRGYVDYEPGDNVVYIFSMGSPTTEALKASEKLLKQGIYAHIIVVTSHDLLLGNLGLKNNYFHLKNGLGINGDLHLKKVSYEGDWVLLAGRRIPIVSVHDGEPGLLDNIGSLIGVKQEALAVRQHSKCGRPSDIYKFHRIDNGSIIEAVGKVLAETALESVQVREGVLRTKSSQSYTNWKELWGSNFQK